LLIGLSATVFVGCENLPGSKGTQGAVVGGASGATVGAVVGGTEHRALGALLGAALGAAGGYVVGANSDRILGKDRDSAQEAARQSQERPATAQDAARATTADVNNDGFVTLDEVVAMKDAGLTDAQMIDRMRATNQVFELTADQRQYLYDRGVSRSLVDQMESINKETRDRLMTTNRPATSFPSSDSTSTLPTVPRTPPVISQPPSTIPQRY
jgi:hypothetical protein